MARWGIRCQGTGDSLLPHPAAGTKQPIRATKSRNITQLLRQNRVDSHWTHILNSGGGYENKKCYKVLHGMWIAKE